MGQYGASLGTRIFKFVETKSFGSQMTPPQGYIVLYRFIAKIFTNFLHHTTELSGNDVYHILSILFYYFEKIFKYRR